MIADALDTCSTCGRRPTRLAIVGAGSWRVRCACETRLERIVGDSSEVVGEPPIAPTAQELGKLRFIRRLLADLQPAAGTLVQTYLRSRGIAIVPEAVRFVPSLKHWPSGLMLPAMIAAIVDIGGNVIGLHRTFLDPSGEKKANVSHNRMMLGASKTGSVRLAPAAEGLGVSEGIESGLSAMQEMNVAVWAALSTTGLQALNLPSSVLEVTIFADSDPPGIAAARKAARRWRAEGRVVEILRPKDSGKDFNDLLLEEHRA